MVDVDAYERYLDSKAKAEEEEIQKLRKQRKETFHEYIERKEASFRKSKRPRRKLKIVGSKP